MEEDSPLINHPRCPSGCSAPGTTKIDPELGWVPFLRPLWRKVRLFIPIKLVLMTPIVPKSPRFSLGVTASIFVINMANTIRPDAHSVDQEIETQEPVKSFPVATQEESGEVIRNQRQTPLPRLQLFFVLLIQFSEPTTATVIYPFLNQFVRDTGITQGDDRKTGYYAGVIVSLVNFGHTNWIIPSPPWNVHARNRSSFSQKLLRSSSGDGYLIVLGESLSYCLDLWVWAPQYWNSDILHPFGQWYCRDAFKASSTAASASSLSSVRLQRSIEVFYQVFRKPSSLRSIAPSLSIWADCDTSLQLSDSTNMGDALSLMPLMWSSGVTIGYE